MKLFKKYTPYKYGKHSKYSKYIATRVNNYIECTNMQTNTSAILSINDLKNMIKHNKNILVFGKSGIGKCTAVQEYLKGVK